MPKGADTVVRQEDTAGGAGSVDILIPPDKCANIRMAGENVRTGDNAIPAGTVIRPPHIGMLASFSRSFISVFQQPRVAILSTGDEIAEIDDPHDPTKIVNSNMYSIAAQVKECGAQPMMLGIARDTKKDLLTRLAYARSADVIITTGGVSVGEYDYVKRCTGGHGCRNEILEGSHAPRQTINLRRYGRYNRLRTAGKSCLVHGLFRAVCPPCPAQENGT